ncbi:MAG: hypothetical protein V2A73_12380 [Pseudomonadota bacterium]
MLHGRFPDMRRPFQSSRIALVFVVAVTLTGLSARTLAAEKDDWSRSFDPKTAVNDIPAGELAIIVVAAGPSSTSVSAAAAALAQALRASERTKLVMDDASIGSVESLDDPAIVAKCRRLPVTHVAVVRTFAGKPGQPSQAVVTFYDKAGETVAALAVTAGSGTPAPASTAGASSGVSASTMDAVSQVVKVQEKSAADARQEYEQRYVGFSERVNHDE